MGNLGSAVLAVLLSLMVWVVAVNEGNPPRQDRFPSVGLPIEVVNKPEDLVLFDALDQRVTLTIRAPQTGWNDLRPSDFRAFIDLAELNAGVHDVEVQVRCPECSKKQVRILDLEPSQVSVRLEQVRRKEMEVQVNVLDSAAPSYIFRSPTVTPARVTVSGPRSQVDQVVSVVANVFLGGAKTTVERQSPAVARDNQGNLVKGIELSPAIVTVRVPVEQRAGYKEVSVRAATTGTPASGYWISNIQVDPATITVVGLPEVIDKLGGFVDTKTVDINKAQRTVRERVGLVVPDGVSILSVQDVVVEVTVLAMTGGQTIQRPFTLRGKAPTLQAKVSPEKIDVILSGPLPELQKLKPEDLVVVLDLTGLTQGTYKLKPQITPPESLKVENTIPSEVEVVLTVAKTP
jgi:YbbR domain-containing protein